MICPYRINEVCMLSVDLIKIASPDSNVTVPCTQKCFESCSKCAIPFTINYVVCCITRSKLKKIGIRSGNVYQDLAAGVKGGYHGRKGGPGTELKRIFEYFRIIPATDCNCEWHAYMMDLWGPLRCRMNINTIVGWLEESSKKNKLWKWVFNKNLAARVVNAACDLCEGRSWANIVIDLVNIFKKSDDNKTLAEIKSVTR